MPKPTLRIFALVALTLLPPASLTAGVIQTLDGTRHEGDVRFTPEGRLTVTPSGAAKPTAIDLHAILTADFRATANPAPPAHAAKPAPRWISRDVGRVARPGAAMLAQGNMLVQASGQDIGGSEDSFHFAYRPLTGDGELVARITNLEPAERAVKVGVMMRGNIDPGSAYAMALLIPRSGLSLQSRPRPGGPSVQRGPGIGVAGVPVWVRLRRQQNKFSAYSSDDGRNWNLLGQEEIELPATLLAGVAAASRSGIVYCNATFERLTLTGGVADDDKNVPSSPEARARGIVFRSGAFLSGSNPRMPDESTVRINRDREYSFPASQVASVFLRERTAELGDTAARLARPGAMFENGDFFEGSIIEADRGRVRVSSVLFGLRQFDQGRVRAVVLNAPTPSPSRFEFKLADGSILFADELSFDKDRLVVPLPAGQSIKLRHGDVLELNAGAGRFQSLGALKPASVEAPPDVPTPHLVVNAAPGGLPLFVAGRRTEQAVALAAGASATFSLQGQYKTLTAMLGVPDHVLPTVPLTFVILADGVEVHRSADRTALDEPTGVTLALTSVRSLVLRVESPHPALGGCGVFAAPTLVK